MNFDGEPIYDTPTPFRTPSINYNNTSRKGPLPSLPVASSNGPGFRDEETISWDWVIGIVVVLLIVGLMFMAWWFGPRCYNRIRRRVIIMMVPREQKNTTPPSPPSSPPSSQSAPPSSPPSSQSSSQSSPPLSQSSPSDAQEDLDGSRSVSLSEAGNHGENSALHRRVLPLSASSLSRRTRGRQSGDTSQYNKTSVTQRAVAAQASEYYLAPSSLSVNMRKPTNAF